MIGRWLLWALLAGYSGSILCAPLLRTTLTPQEAWVGQRVILGIDVLSDRGWAKISRFGALEINGAYVLPSNSQGARLQETIDGIAYSGQRYELSIYPQRAGTLDIPVLALEVTTRGWGAGAAVTVQELRTDRMRLRTKVPPGAASIRGLISTTLLSATQSWAPTLAVPKVGDAIKRTIEFQAADVSGMAFAPLKHEPIPGLGIYPAQPTVKDATNRGQLNGTRIETVTYVLERAGEIQLPGVVLSWWDIGVGELKRIELPGQQLKVTAAPGMSSELSGAIQGRQQNWPLWLLLILLPVLLLSYYLRDDLVDRWRRWQRRRDASEARCFRRAIIALESGDTKFGYRQIMRWLDRISDTSEPARLDHFLHRYGDASVQRAAVALAHNLATGNPIAQPSILLNGLKSARNRWQRSAVAEQQRPSVLPGLNPGWREQSFNLSANMTGEC